MKKKIQETTATRKPVQPLDVMHSVYRELEFDVEDDDPRLIARLRLENVDVVVIS